MQIDKIVLPVTTRAALPPIYASDSDFVAAKGSVATLNDVYINNVSNTIRRYDSEWIDISEAVIRVPLPVTTNGQVTFTLPTTPSVPEEVFLTVAGLNQEYGVAYEVVGNILTWLNAGFELSTTDTVEAYYFGNASSITAGLALVKNTVYTVGSGKNYETLNAAIDSLQEQLLDNQGTVVLQCDAGTMANADIKCWGIRGTLVINGDLLRGAAASLAGLSFVHNTNPLTGIIAASGSGNITLSVTGKTVTVSRATGNPNFNGLLQNGDVIYGVSGTVVEWTDVVASVSGNSITVTNNNLPTLNVAGAGFSIKANRNLGSYKLYWQGDGRLIMAGFSAQVILADPAVTDSAGWLPSTRGFVQLSRGNYGGAIYAGKVVVGNPTNRRDDNYSENYASRLYQVRWQVQDYGELVLYGFTMLLPNTAGTYAIRSPGHGIIRMYDCIISGGSERTILILYRSQIWMRNCTGYLAANFLEVGFGSIAYVMSCSLYGISGNVCLFAYSGSQLIAEYSNITGFTTCVQLHIGTTAILFTMLYYSYTYTCNISNNGILYNNPASYWHGCLRIEK